MPKHHLSLIGRLSLFFSSVSLFCFFPFALAVPLKLESVELKNEVEFRVALKKSGYEKLSQGLNFEKSEKRTDLYLDLYSDGQFQFQASEPPKKTRIMKKKEKYKYKYKWQVSSKIASQPVNHQSISGQITFKESLNIKDKDFSEIVSVYEYGSEIFEKLKLSSQGEHFSLAAEPDALKKLLLNFDSGIRILSELTQTISGLPQNGYLVPANLSEKNRLEKTLIVSGVELSVQLGITQGTDSLGLLYETYEIEAEKPGSLLSSDIQLAQDFFLVLQNAGVGAEDIEPGSKDSFEFARAAYDEIFAQ